MSRTNRNIRRIEELENMLLYCVGWLSATGSELDWELAGKIEACLGRRKESYVEPALTWEDHLEIEATGTLNPVRAEAVRERQRTAHAPKSSGGDLGIDTDRCGE